MIKPMSVIRIEFIAELTKLINNCGLPPFVIEPIIRDVLNEVKIATNNQYEIDKHNYEASLGNEEGDENKYV